MSTNDNGQHFPGPPDIVLIPAAAVMLILFAVATAAIVYVPVARRIEGLFLILLAIVADAFLAGFIQMVGMIAHRLFNRPDIMGDVFRRNYRVAGNLVSGLFLLPMIVAVIRILGLR